MKSMTGCSIKEFDCDCGKFKIEIRSVNGRYLDLSLRIPRDFFKYEDEFRKIIDTKIKRGRVSLFIKFEPCNNVNYNIKPDYALASAYVEASDKIKAKLQLKEDISYFSILSNYFDDIFKKDDALKDEDNIGNKLKDCLVQGVNDFDAMRQEEGEFIKEKIKENVNNINKIVDKIEKIAPEIIIEYKDKLKEKIFKLFEDVNVDNDRLLTEAGIYAERHDFTEEIVRLRSHINMFLKNMNKDVAIGKKIDFIIQEMNREVNTIGSKANDFSISELVVEAKSEVEKIREQIQNIE